MSYKNMTLVKPDSATYIISNAQFSIARPSEDSLEIEITKDQFLAAVQEEIAVSPYSPNKHNGLRNPYTGKVVESKADYEEYIREYTFHRLCEEGTVSAYNSKISSVILRAEARNQEAQKKIRFKYRVIAFLLCAVLVSSFIYIGISSDDSRENYNVGYAAGQNDGYDQGYKAGTSVKANTSFAGSSEAQGETVYITKNGTKYHRQGCSYLGSSIPIHLPDAIDGGYTPCSRCNPPQ